MPKQTFDPTKVTPEMLEEYPLALNLGISEKTTRESLADAVRHAVLISEAVRDEESCIRRNERVKLVEAMRQELSRSTATTPEEWLEACRGVLYTNKWPYEPIDLTKGEDIKTLQDMATMNSLLNIGATSAGVAKAPKTAVFGALLCGTPTVSACMSPVDAPDEADIRRSERKKLSKAMREKYDRTYQALLEGDSDDAAATSAAVDVVLRRTDWVNGPDAKER